LKSWATAPNFYFFSLSGFLFLGFGILLCVIGRGFCCVVFVKEAKILVGTEGK
jgi:hypothetical protein